MGDGEPSTPWRASSAQPGGPGAKERPVKHRAFLGNQVALQPQKKSKSSTQVEGKRIEPFSFFGGVRSLASGGSKSKGGRKLTSRRLNRAEVSPASMRHTDQSFQGKTKSAQLAIMTANPFSQLSKKRSPQGQKRRETHGRRGSTKFQRETPAARHRHRTEHIIFRTREWVSIRKPYRGTFEDSARSSPVSITGNLLQRRVGVGATVKTYGKPLQNRAEKSGSREKQASEEPGWPQFGQAQTSKCGKLTVVKRKNPLGYYRGGYQAPKTDRVC